MQKASRVASEKLPSISIVIPTYNSERTLAQCLESIVGQDYPREKIEIIVADEGSEDKTLKIARKYKVDKIHLLICPLVLLTYGVGAIWNFDE